VTRGSLTNMNISVVLPLVTISIGTIMVTSRKSERLKQRLQHIFRERARARSCQQTWASHVQLPIRHPKIQLTGVSPVPRSQGQLVSSLIGSSLRR